MYKLVNGVRVELTAEEATEIQNEWDTNTAEKLEEQRLYGYIRDQEESKPDLKDQVAVIVDYLKTIPNKPPELQKLVDVMTTIETEYPRPAGSPKRDRTKRRR